MHTYTATNITTHTQTHIHIYILLLGRVKKRKQTRGRNQECHKPAGNWSKQIVWWFLWKERNQPRNSSKR